jgi:hypothetical protein
MWVATVFRLTKNEYDSNAEGAFVECTPERLVVVMS